MTAGVLLDIVHTTMVLDATNGKINVMIAQLQMNIHSVGISIMLQKITKGKKKYLLQLKII